MMDNFMNDYTEQLIANAQESGVSQEELDKQIEEIKMYSDMYENPFFRFGITLIEVLPVGIIITLISAALLRRKDVLPAEPAVA
jgi:hypothetical protein